MAAWNGGRSGILASPTALLVARVGGPTTTYKLLQRVTTGGWMNIISTRLFVTRFCGRRAAASYANIYLLSLPSSTPACAALRARRTAPPLYSVKRRGRRARRRIYRQHGSWYYPALRRRAGRLLNPAACSLRIPVLPLYAACLLSLIRIQPGDNASAFSLYLYWRAADGAISPATPICAFGLRAARAVAAALPGLPPRFPSPGGSGGSWRAVERRSCLLDGGGDRAPVFFPPRV